MAVDMPRMPPPMMMKSYTGISQVEGVRGIAVRCCRQGRIRRQVFKGVL